MKNLTIVFLIGILLKVDVVNAGTSFAESASGFLTSLPPGIPLLRSPSDAMTNVPDSITITWYSQLHISSYTLQVSSTADFSDLILNETNSDTSFTITNLNNNTTYYWRINASNVAGDGMHSAVRYFTTLGSSSKNTADFSKPENYALFPVYPNPFNPVTTISYDIPEKSGISIIIYNIIGQPVCDLSSGYQNAGRYTLQWNAKDQHGVPVTNGLYICHLKAGSHVFKQKMMYMR